MGIKNLGVTLIKIGIILFVWSICLFSIFTLLGEKFRFFNWIVAIFVITGIICITTGIMKEKKGFKESLILIGVILFFIGLLLVIFMIIYGGILYSFSILFFGVIAAGVICIIIGGLTSEN